MKTPEKPVVNPYLFDVPLTGNSSDDECSISSTVSVEDPPKQEPLSPFPESATLSSSSCSDRPRVRFDESSNLFYTNTLYEEKGCFDSWYSAEEYQNFKAAVSFMAKMIDRAEGGTVDNGCHQVPRDPLSYTGILEATYNACCQVHLDVVHFDKNHHSGSNVLSEPQQRHLRHLFSLEIGIGRLGLERRSVREVARDKSRRRSDLLEIVENAGLLSCEEELRRQCETISLASRLFAQQLAHAQMMAPVATFNTMT